MIEVSIAYDLIDPTINAHKKLIDALNDNFLANEKFNNLTPSAIKEIVSYISFLKTVVSIDKNVHKAIQFLLGNATTFIGRANPKK